MIFQKVFNNQTEYYLFIRVYIWFLMKRNSLHDLNHVKSVHVINILIAYITLNFVQYSILCNIQFCTVHVSVS